MGGLWSGVLGCARQVQKAREGDARLRRPPALPPASPRLASAATSAACRSAVSSPSSASARSPAASSTTNVSIKVSCTASCSSAPLDWLLRAHARRGVTAAAGGSTVAGHGGATWGVAPRRRRPARLCTALRLCSASVPAMRRRRLEDAGNSHGAKHPAAPPTCVLHLGGIPLRLHGCSGCATGGAQQRWEAECGLCRSFRGSATTLSRASRPPTPQAL